MINPFQQGYEVHRKAWKNRLARKDKGETMKGKSRKVTDVRRPSQTSLTGQARKENGSNGGLDGRLVNRRWRDLGRTQNRIDGPVLVELGQNGLSDVFSSPM